MSRDVHQLVLDYGRNATAYQILNAGFEHAWIGDAVVGYVRARAWPGGPTVRVAAGVPIGPEAALAPAVARFDALARSEGGWAIWFGVEPPERPLFSGHAELVVGSQPAWDPRQWDGLVAAHASVRSQIRRAGNKGVRVEEWAPAAASAHPGLHRCLHDWQASRGLSTLRFLTDPLVLHQLGDRRVFVAVQPSDDGDRVVAYALLAPVPARRGWLVEWIIQGAGAPNGTPARLLDAAMRAVAADGAAWATLGLAALSTRAPLSSTPPPVVIRALLAWTRAHARRFYNFEGLERFKAKFRPAAWEPVRLYADQEALSLPTLYALADAFSGARSPVGVVTRALAGAVRDEAAFAAHALRAGASSTP